MSQDLNKLQYKILFAILVAGKSASFAQKKMEAFRETLVTHVSADTWFGAIQLAIQSGQLEKILKTAKTGRYRGLQLAFASLLKAELDLATCTIEQLERIYGIGYKTSRFFHRWSNRRPNDAILDTHILRWLRELGYEDIPDSTPQSQAKYDEVAAKFLKEAQFRKIHPADLDEQIWLQMNTSGIRK